MSKNKYEMSKQNDLSANQQVTSLDTLDGHEFEDIVEKLIKQMGFVTDERKRAADGGIDISAVSEQPLLGGRYIIQCKRYSKPVGEPVIRDLFGVVNSERANKGILISNSTFTNEALEFAKEKPLELIGGEKLAKLLDNYLTNSSKKNSDGHLVVKELARAVLETIEPKIQKLSSRMYKIKNKLILLGETKPYKTPKGYIDFVNDKIRILPNITQTLVSQLNFLNEVINKTDDYRNLREVKSHCGELASTLEVLVKEWESVMKLQPYAGFERSQSLLMGVYEHVFKRFEEFTFRYSEIVNKPKELTFETDATVELNFSLDLPKNFEREFSEEFDKASRRASGQCFVATAVYQSPDAPEVQILRRWRDSELSRSLYGRLLIYVYYSVGRPLGYLVKKFPPLLNQTKILLDRLVNRIKKEEYGSE